MTVNRRFVEDFRFSGYAFALASVLFYFLQTSLVPYMPDVPVLQLTCFRLAIQTVITTPIVLLTKATFFGEEGDRLNIFLRGLMSVMVAVTTYASIYLMPIADSMTIRFTAPAFVTIMARLVLKEPVDLVQSFFVFVSIFGAVMVAQPAMICDAVRELLAASINQSSVLSSAKDINVTKSSNLTTITESMTTNDFSDRYTIHGRLLGTCYGLLGVICVGAVYVLLRKLQHVQASTVLFVYSFAGAYLVAILNGFFGHWNFDLSVKTWIFQILVGVLGAFAQIFLILALKFESAAPVSIIRSLQIVLAFLYQTLWMEVYPNVYSVIGAILVTSSVVSHGVRKMLREKDEHEIIK